MPEDRKDLFAAFAIGAIVGIGATLLLAPEPQTPARRIIRKFGPALRRAQSEGRRVKKRVRKTLRSYR